jgi:hypothetical protein
MSSVTPDDERDFSCMYLAWLQCGMDTNALDEDRERLLRQAPFEAGPALCPHGASKLTCTICYFNNDYRR